MAGFIGKIDAFEESKEDWPTYIERVEQYFIANGVDGDKKVPALLSLIGSKAYSLLRSLTAPVKPSEKTYDEIVKILTDHLSPKPLITAERFRFYKRQQNEGENIMSYVAELRKLTQYCNFGDYLNDALRDQLVCGIRNENIQKRLLSTSELTLAKAVNIAVGMETAARDAEEFQGRLPASPGVHGVFTACYRCGNTDHIANTCRFKSVTCRNCGKKGHIQKVCRSNPKIPKPPKSGNPKKLKKHGIHAVQNNSDSDSEEFDAVLGSIEVHSIKNSKSSVIWITPEVQGKPLKMELDTGSAVSILPLHQYQKMYPKVKLKKTATLLKTSSGEKIKPRGKMEVLVKYNDQAEVLDIYVVNSSGPPLLGRDWLEKIHLDWQKIKNISVSKRNDSDTTSRLEELLEKYKDVFNEEIGTLKGVKAKLTLKDGSNPKFHKARQVPYALRPKVDAELKRLEQQGIISKTHWSEWATPIVPVPKKDGTVRLCGDFKVSINPVLQVDQYPLPRIEDIFATLSGGQHFSKIDLRQAYLQMGVEEESKKLLTINTSQGLFQYNRLVFGVASAPAIWQRTIEQVLDGIPGTQCILDDMVITGKTDEDHLRNLEMVLKRLQSYGLKAHPKKCAFFQDKIQFCAHEIDKDGLHKTQEKISAVSKAPQPQNVTQLRSFLGLVNYYNHFLPHLSTIVQPLNQLLERNHTWKWTAACEQAFKRAKKLVASDQVLTHYDPDLPIRIASDASPYGLGTVLSHVMKDGTERPIAFGSRSLTKTEQKYSQIDKEALALIWGIKKFHHYLFGRKFTILTDHQPLTQIFHPHKGIPATTAARLQRYALFLSGFEYDIVYKRTAQHSNADCLSRLPLDIASDKNRDSESIDPVHVFHVTQLESLPVTSNMVRQATAGDPILSRVYECVMKGWSHLPNEEDLRQFHSRKNELTVQNGCLLWGMRVVIPSKLRYKVLQELHQGHAGVVRMKALARSYVWWPGIDQSIENLAKSCPGCQHSQKMPKVAPLHPWEWPSEPWQRLHIDFAGPFLDTMFLVVVDSHSKWPEVIPMSSTTSSKTIETLKSLFARFGVPEQIVSDNGPQFTSHEFQMFVKRNGIKHITSAPYHPSTNGLAERFVQSFKNALRSMKQEKKTLKEKLESYLLSYRNTAHPTTSETPAKLLMGRNLRTRLDLLKPDIKGKVQQRQMDQGKERCSRPVRELDVGETVAARDYTSPNKWKDGVINARTGPLSYEVKVAPNQFWRRHIDQLISTKTKEQEERQQRNAAATTNAETNEETTWNDGEKHDSLQDLPELEKSTSTPATTDKELPETSITTQDRERRYPVRERHPPDRFI